MATLLGPGYLFARAWYGIDSSKASVIPIDQLGDLPDDDIDTAFASLLEAEVANDKSLTELVDAYASLATAIKESSSSEAKSLDELLDDLACVRPDAIPWHIDARRRHSRLAQLLKATGLLVPHGVALQEKGHKGPRLGPTRRAWVGKLKNVAIAPAVINALAELLADESHVPIVLHCVPSSALDVATRYRVETEIQTLALSTARPRPSRSDPGYTEACVEECVRQAAVHVTKVEAFLESENQLVGSDSAPLSQSEHPATESPQASATVGRVEQLQGVDHGSDYSWLRVGERVFRFTSPSQRAVIRALHDSWSRAGGVDGAGVSNSELIEQAGLSSDRLRLERTFEGNAALGTLIRPTGKGQWALYVNDLQG